MSERESIEKEAIGLLSAAPTREALIKLISWIDSRSVDQPLDSLPRLVLARSVIAAGLAMKTDVGDRVKNTISAACNFALRPTDKNRRLFFQASTNSYPYGPGEGCYEVAETGFEGCEIGSGCRSGAGTLHLFALAFGHENLMKVISDELLPWLQGEDDIVARREEKSSR